MTHLITESTSLKGASAQRPAAASVSLRESREKMNSMSDQPGPATKPVLKVTGLGPKAQKLQALRDKAAQAKSGGKVTPHTSAQAFKAKDSFANTKKTSFQRKAT